MNTEANKELVKKVNDAFAEANLEKVLSYFADDVRWTMVGKGTWEGKETIRASMNDMDMGGGAPPVFTIDSLITENDRAVCQGDMEMQNPDGSLWKGSYCDMYRIRDGKVAELLAFVIEDSKDGQEAAK